MLLLRILDQILIEKIKILILTCDGAGDGVSATVSIGYKNKIKRLSSTKKEMPQLVKYIQE